MLHMLALIVSIATSIAIPPMPTSYVTDEASALSSGAQQKIERELRSYYDATGNRVFVYIGQTTGDTPLEDWTIHAAEKWRPGTKKKDNGAILFVFMRDHKVRIEVGYGLESSLTDAESSRIIRDAIRPRMRANDVDGAIQGGVDQMLVTITPSYKDRIGHAVPAETTSDSNSAANAIALALIVLVFFGVLGLIFYLSAKSGRRGGAWYWGGSGAGWSSGGGSWGGGGGGFSGGFGGGFGGGGASGGW
jgi:uncharacterized protein